MIRVRDIIKYYGDLQVLKGIDLDIKQGEIVTIIGPSGAGKTTLLQILGTLEKADGGELSVNNVELDTLQHLTIQPAVWYRRLLNGIIDTGIIAGLTGLIFLLVSPLLNIPENPFRVISVPSVTFFMIYNLYYFLFEYFALRTPGKFISRTIVVTHEGYHPDAVSILVRTLSRWIPFDMFSYFQKRPRNGWHDFFSNTLVTGYGKDKKNKRYKRRKMTERELSSFRNKRIGFVFQFHHLLPEFTALENVCIPAFINRTPRHKAEKKAIEILNFLNMKHRLHHKPSELSGGEQQRVAIARALINDPDIILADEPSGNLDSQNTQEINQLFLKLREEFKQTFVIVTHNMEMAKIADRILNMKDGKLYVQEKEEG